MGVISKDMSISILGIFKDFYLFFNICPFFMIFLELIKKFRYISGLKNKNKKHCIITLYVVDDMAAHTYGTARGLHVEPM